MALAGDDAGAIKILEDVSKSSTATATNRQNLALLYGVSGQMAQAQEASRADLPQDVVNRNMAAMSNSGDAAAKQELLKQSLGVELKGRQYAPAAQPAMPLTNLAQTSSIEGEQPVYMSSQQGEAIPVIATGDAARTQTAQSTDVVVKTTGKKDAWSDWDEELVDATDVNGTTGTQTAAAPAQSTTSNITETTTAADSAVSPAQSQPSSQDAGAPRFLSTNAIADDKASTPAAPSKPAASSNASATQMAAAPQTTATASAVEKPAVSASATPAATPTATAEKPAAPTAASSTAATAGTATMASTPASASPGADDSASSMTVTAKTMSVAKVYTVQIASYRSEQEASTGWQALTAEQADLLAKLPHAVAKADLGAEKGIYYRLQAGSFSDRNDAKALCADLKDHAIDCMVVEAAPATAAPTSSQQSMLAPNDSIVIGAR
jgi:hypothetical protein